MMRDVIVITKPEMFPGEAEVVNTLFANGMQRLHLRKPGASEQEMAEWIGRIDLPFRQRIIVHDHHRLLRTMGLGGIHLNARNPEAPAWFSAERQKRRSVTLSRSCHSLEEIAQWKGVCDYLFLSPIFDSISKGGYTSAFTRETLLQAYHDGLFSKPVYALGGVSADNIRSIYDYGFAGAAVIGSLWQVHPFTTDTLVGRLKELQGT
ncbi:MAG: thiamine phosphate synthase [Paraprevotella sp.]|nr:thiamine phosphate synthase [Paraprevotella sp.]